MHEPPSCCRNLEGSRFATRPGTIRRFAPRPWSKMLLQITTAQRKFEKQKQQRRVWSPPHHTPSLRAKGTFTSLFPVPATFKRSIPHKNFGKWRKWGSLATRRFTCAPYVQLTFWFHGVGLRTRVYRDRGTCVCARPIQ